MHRDPFGDREVWQDYFQMWREMGLRVVGYGAPAKATVFLNYCEIDSFLMAFVLDSTPEKQGKFIPGAGIEIVSPTGVDWSRIDVVLILSHNYKDEICEKIPTGPEVWCQLRRLR